MKLIIHDLNETEWKKISEEYSGWHVISDDGNIRPCNGCFCCWNKTPGECVIKDGYNEMGKLIHHAEEVAVISRYTYGGFSGFIKNVIDRCLGYVLPQFEVVNGETHHQKRYPEDKPFTFIFHGGSLTDEEKESAARYVEALCHNFRSHVKEVIFLEDGKKKEIRRDFDIRTDKTVLLNPSMRFTNGNSAKLSRSLNRLLDTEALTVNLQEYTKKHDELMDILEDASKIVICLPLYVDGLPSQLIRFMERYEEEYKGGRKKIYALANMGLYECRQLENLFEAIRQWCEKMDFEYCGGLGVSAGELIGSLMEQLPLGSWPSKKIYEGMKKLADAINDSRKISDIYTQPSGFPRWLYIQIANKSWNLTARKNGLRPKD
ncbi:MAG: flavodoxin family protein, partial [Erysipelotrichaceae bacterium]|nr:flavodoxin family protein [Erysipelotrichaceae bacterium]